MGAAVPATFDLGGPTDGNVLHSACTPGPAPLGDCLAVICNGDDHGLGGELALEVFECIPAG